jgi:hypothetical protein
MKRSTKSQFAHLRESQEIYIPLLALEDLINDIVTKFIAWSMPAQFILCSS